MTLGWHTCTALNGDNRGSFCRILHGLQHGKGRPRAREPAARHFGEGRETLPFRAPSAPLLPKTDAFACGAAVGKPGRDRETAVVLG